MACQAVIVAKDIVVEGEGPLPNSIIELAPCLTRRESYSFSFKQTRKEGMKPGGGGGRDSRVALQFRARREGRGRGRERGPLPPTPARDSGFRMGVW